MNLTSFGKYPIHGNLPVMANRLGVNRIAWDYWYRFYSIDHPDRLTTTRDAGGRLYLLVNSATWIYLLD